MFLIGELARRTGVKVPTIRYYEKIALIDPPRRSEGNQRLYRQQDLERLSFIRHARELGFPLEDIRALIELSTTDSSCRGIHDIALAQLEAVTRRISKLQKLQQELERITAVPDQGKTRQCQVIQALADHTLCQGEH
ncbi:MerR family transcriptional regulator [Thalassomonas actiniarum]|uniref:Helix-turn-helix domain-containing protein n=1 Tax=Thalassomonas actiniarum TaxID=485447 RepID=A0AAF0C217_9GAMM|nr:helix-turn-helix domain-containing protein [Thalassomonas actiniarum]WDD99591.1 helix-turn-helix domain-containing protein [Thalassomonas actiniarum]